MARQRRPSNGTQMGWLIDPAEQTVFIYHPKQETEVFDEAEVLLPVPSFAGDLGLTVKNLFDWLLE
nr:Uma2 family endonuclease [Pseudanabaena sp. FACHB-2040]